MNKTLVIGDCHFDNKYPTYLQDQLDTLDAIIRAESPENIVFLGDVFHNRKPCPEVVVKVFDYFKKISLYPGLKEIFILRGNHDSDNKSDDGLSILSIFNYPGSKVKVALQTTYIPHLDFYFIPHYENEKQVLLSLKSALHFHLQHNINAASNGPIVFGHFGYKGCMNATGYFDFSIELSEFEHTTFLGHIHKELKNGKVHILGTPWATNFGESEIPHYYAVLERGKNNDWNYNLHEITHGLQYLTIPFEAIETYIERLKDPKLKFYIRILMDKVGATDIVTLEESSNIRRIEIKFNPVFDKKLNDRISDYAPTTKIDEISDDVIDKYLEEQKSTIPTEELRKGLDTINLHVDKDDSNS